MAGLLFLNSCSSTGAIQYDHLTKSAIQDYITDTRPWVEADGQSVALKHVRGLIFDIQVCRKQKD